MWFYKFIDIADDPGILKFTVTLGIPWNEDDLEQYDVEDCYIYEIQKDGTLHFISNFRYDESNDSTTGIEGWTFKTESLGHYVVASERLNIADARLQWYTSYT